MYFYLISFIDICMVHWYAIDEIAHQNNTFLELMVKERNNCKLGQRNSSRFLVGEIRKAW